ncbi:DUF6504 family protein [Luteococcus sp. H138]|uniref:DUF6504 family protein n=1 Tax=unclassified Luteococcus TaxID=2639923 RepID=UPI00313AB7FF
MRRCDEAIEVRLGRVGDDEGPSQFLWRNKLWRVLTVQQRWIESGSWWEHAESGSDDLLREREVWRVEAAAGQYLSRGVYELDHAWADGSWRLRTVVD